METKSSSPEVNDIENIGSQNPSRIFVPGEDKKSPTHKLVIKQQQPNFGSDDFECGIHDLYLFSGENALRLNRGAASSVLVDTQEDSNTIIPAIISYERSQGSFETNENQFLYIDLDSDSNLLTIKDFREVVAPSQDTNQSGKADAADLHEDANDQDSHRVVVEIARKNSPSCYEQLPLRQLRILQPGSRVRLSSKSTSPLILEYIFNRVPGPAAEDPSIRNSLNPLTQPQEDSGCLKTQIDIGSPPRSRAEEINAGLLTQPQEDDDMAQSKESLVEGEQSAYKTLPGSALQGDHLTNFGDTDDSSSEVTEGMTQPDGLLPVRHTLSTDHPTNPPISDEEEGKDPSMESSPPQAINGGQDIKGDQNSTLPSLYKGDDGIVVNAEKLPCDTPSNAKESSSEDDMIISSSERACIEGEEPQSLLGIGYLSPTPAQSQGVSERLVQQTGMETLPPSTPMRLDNDGPEDDSSSITDVHSAFTSPKNVDSSTKLSLPDIERARSPAKETNADHDSELTEIESPVVDSKVQTNEEAFHKQAIDDTKLPVDNGKVKEEKLNDVELQVEEEKDTALQGSKESSSVGTVGADPRLAMVEAQTGKGNLEGQGVVTIAASSEVVFTSNHQNDQECPVIDPSLTNISSPRDSNKLFSVSASPGLLNFGSEGSPPESVARHSRTKCKALAGGKAKKLMAADKIKVQETKNNKRKLDEIESGTPSATSTPRSTRSLRRRIDRDLPYRIMATQMGNPTAAKKWVKKLGGVFYENISEASKASHLVIGTKDGAPNLVRSPKLMIAIARACHIVHSQFFEKSIERKKFEEEESFYLHNMKQKNVVKALETFNKKYKCNLKKSMDRARNLNDDGRQLFSGMHVYLCKGVSGNKDSNNKLSTPTANDFRAILGGAGAQVINELPTSFPEGTTTLIITSTDEEKKGREKGAREVKNALKNANVKALTAQDIFDSITRQVLPEGVI